MTLTLASILESLETFTSLPGSIWDVWLAAAPWLGLGLVLAGLVKAWVPQAWLQRWLGRRGPGTVVRAALIGAPLPLCSCGVLPAAIGLRRQGASKGATVSFLVATPETSAESIMISYALLGPFMAVMRPVAAIISAIFSGLVAELAPEPPITAPAASRAGGDCCHDSQPACSTEGTPAVAENCCSDTGPDCCGKTAATPAAHCCSTSPSGSDTQAPGPMRRAVAGVRFALTDLLDDIAKWLIIGIVLAGAIHAFVPEEWLADLGWGLPAMLVMLAVGVPMYICATASTPVAASLLMAGVSPGAVLVFLLVGPATNIAAIGVVRRELGTTVAVLYLLSLSFAALLFGMLTDYLVQIHQIRFPELTHDHAHDVLNWIAVGSAVLLIVLAIRPLRRALGRLLHISAPVAGG